MSHILFFEGSEGNNDIQSDGNSKHGRHVVPKDMGPPLLFPDYRYALRTYESMKPRLLVQNNTEVNYTEQDGSSSANSTDAFTSAADAQ